MLTEKKILARSPLHPWHRARGARLRENEGWEEPAVYTEVKREMAAARNGLALADISSFAKVSVMGSGVPQWVQTNLGGTPASKPMGVGVFSGNGLACRLTQDQVLLLASSPRLALPAAGLEVQAFGMKMDAARFPDTLVVDNQTSTYAGFSLIGNPIEDLLRRLTALDVSEISFPKGTCVQTSLAGTRTILVRHSELQIPSMRLYVPWDQGEYLWEKLLAFGSPWQIVPLGLEAWEQLRVA